MDHEARTELIIKNSKNPMFLARQFLIDNPNFVTAIDPDDRQLVYHYNGKCWELIADDTIKKMAYRFYQKFNLEHFCKPNKISELIQAIFFGTDLKEVVMNEDDSKLVVNNGILDLNTHALSPHAPGYFYDSYSPVDYDPSLTEADCPVFMSFLHEVLSDNEMYIRNALMLGGYLFDYSLKANKLFFMDGPGASGKSTLLNTYLMFWKDSQVSSLSLDQISSESFDKESLVKSRVNQSGEQKRAYVAAEVLKLISEGARVSISRKYLKTISVKLKTKIVLACNGMPKFSDTSDGIYRRLCILTFRNRYKSVDEYDQEFKKGDHYIRSMCIKKQDPLLFEKIEKEKSAIFNVFIKYLQILRERNYSFHSSISEIAEFKADNDTVTEFLINNYVLSDKTGMEDWVTLQELMDHYRNWYIDNVGSIHSLKLRSNELGRRITEQFGVLSSEKRKIVKDVNGSVTRQRLYPIRRSTSSLSDSEIILGVADGSLIVDRSAMEPAMLNFNGND